MSTQSIETITLHAVGAIPGIPGEHAPGTYTVDYVARTITPLEQTPGAEPVVEPALINETAQPVTPTQDEEVQTYAATHSGEQL